jgi:xanthine dehydrogenase small subunit
MNTADAHPKQPPPADAARPIRFFHRGRVVSVDGVPPTRSVLDWLREDAGCTGTKEGCNEGDCGACTVVIAERAEVADAVGTPSARSTIVDGLSLRTANACLQFLPTLDGKALFTVEDLKAMTGDDALHPVQQAMVECHGSQCGFCTPGFVMSLWSAYERGQARQVRPSRQQIADELSGNLCRCTGYRPILDAAQRMFELEPVRLATAPVREALLALQSQSGIGANGRAAVFLYAAANPATGRAGEARIDRFIAPRTLESLAEVRAERPQARLLAGSTDIGLWVTKQFRDLGDLIYLGDVPELKRIRVEPRDGEPHLVIGAGAPLEDAWAALAAYQPSFTDMWMRFASPPIRHAGTMGGNVANGSPIGDSAPVLMALDASIHLLRGPARRSMPLRAFYVDYMRNRLEPGELVEAVSVPLRRLEASPDRPVRAYKISKRFDCDISAVCAGLAVDLERSGSTRVVRAARFAFGGMAAIVRRATGVEAAVIGQPWSEATVEAAAAALAREFTPLSDMRASAAYRTKVAQNLLRRFGLETVGDAPLASAQTSVFQPMHPVALATPDVLA